MSKKLCMLPSKSVSRQLMPVMLVSVALLTSGCSTFSRFDFPIFGLTSDPDKQQGTGSLQGEEFYPSPREETRPYRPSNRAPYNGAPYNSAPYNGADQDDRYSSSNFTPGYGSGGYTSSGASSRLGYTKESARRYASNDRDLITRSDLPEDTAFSGNSYRADHYSGAQSSGEGTGFGTGKRYTGQSYTGQRYTGKRYTAPRNTQVRPLSGAGRDPYVSDRKEYETAYADYSRRGVQGGSSGFAEPVREPYQGEPYRADYTSGSRAALSEPRFSGSTRGTVTVQKGDTLYSIAKRNGVSVDQMREANALSGNNIHVGQTLTLPAYQTASYSEGAVRGPSFGDRSQPAAGFDAREAEAYAANGAPRKRYAGGPAKRVYDTAELRDIDTAQGPDRRVLGGKPRQQDLREEEDLAEDQGPEMVRQKEAGREKERTAMVRDADPAGQRPSLEQKQMNASEEKKVASLPEPPKAGEENIEMPNTTGRFRWPVRGRIISHFGGKENGAKNDGINISVPEGTEVKAAESGVVAYAGNELKGYGKLILIRHEDNWVTAYAHNSEILVQRGDTIRRGQVIAKAGKTGAVSQPQVHFEVRRGSTPVDPLKFM